LNGNLRGEKKNQQAPDIKTGRRLPSQGVKKGPQDQPEQEGQAEVGNRQEEDQQIHPWIIPQQTPEIGQ
jgi:hypothetical protein